MFWVFSLLMTVMAVAVIVTNLIFGSVHGMTIAIGSTLIGVCIDYPIHVLVHAQGMALEQRLASERGFFYPALLNNPAQGLIAVNLASTASDLIARHPRQIALIQH
jgi:hypothetical protein